VFDPTGMRVDGLKRPITIAAHLSFSIQDQGAATTAPLIDAQKVRLV
jgi:hypothetical protein